MNIQGIIYVISTIMLIVSFILIKKIGRKINIVSMIGVTILLELCYNAFVCYVLTFFNIPNNLYVLAIINFIISAILLVNTFKNKEKNINNTKEKINSEENIRTIINDERSNRQENKNVQARNMQTYYIDKLDVFAVIVLFIITVTIGIINFRIPFDIKYESGDASVHFLTSVKFMQDERLLTNSQDNAYDFSVRKFGSYVNTGILMKCFENKIDIMDNYIIFILFSIFILFLTGVLLYIVLIRFIKSNNNKILALVFSVICTLGYPLSSMLFGFEYLSLGLAIILGIIEIILLCSKEKMRLSYMIIALFILNFGLFCSYYMFVPFIYVAEWIYFCICSYKKDRKIFTKTNVLILSLTLLLPFVLGYIYHFMPNVYQVIINMGNKIEVPKVNIAKQTLNNGFKVGGYIYTNLYSNFILLIPFSLYVVIKKFKENMLLSLIFIFNILFIIILYIGNMFEKVSDYYLAKNYFTLWIIMFILNFRGFMYIYEQYKRLLYTLITLYILIGVVYIAVLPINMQNEENMRTSRESFFTIMDIYGANKDILLNHSADLYNEEIELFKYAVKKYNLSDNYVLVAEPKQLMWVYAMTGYIKENNVTEKIANQDKFNATIFEYIDLMEDADYVIYFKNSIIYQVCEKYIFKDARVLLNNEIGGIVKKVN